MAARLAVLALPVYLWFVPASAFEPPKITAELRRDAESGDAAAQYELAMKLWLGADAERDGSEALAWCLKAAEHGYLPAQNHLASAYIVGAPGIVPDEAVAVSWFRRAAEQGDLEAQIQLGNAYAEGWGVPRDDTEAVRWYRKVADKGNEVGEWELGRMYEAGRGVTKDEAKAAQLYRTAANQNEFWAQAALARLQARGTGVVRDPVCAYFWYSFVAKDRKAAASERDEVSLTVTRAGEELDALALTLTPAELAEGKRLVASTVVTVAHLRERVQHALCPQEPIRGSLADSPLRAFVSQLETLTGLRVVVPAPMDFKITAQLDGVPWATALTEILKPHGYGWTREGDIIRLESLPAPPSP